MQSRNCTSPAKHSCRSICLPLFGFVQGIQESRVPDKVFSEWSLLRGIPMDRRPTSGSAMLAISFGRPVVAPRLGHLQDVVNPDCGVLYDPSKEEGLTRAMQDVQDRRFDDVLILQHARSFEWRDAAMKTISALE